MAHTIYAGNVSKRKNSTLQPSLGASFDVLLKTPTSLHTPTFTINAGSFDYNYLKWGDRYYFVTDVVSRNNNLWEVSAVVDVLATYKADILNTTAYVLYDSVANTELPDNRLPIKTTKTVQTSTTACPLVLDGGCYILSITGSNNSTGVYKCTENELAALIDDVSNIMNNLFTLPSPPTPPSGHNNVSEWLDYWCNYAGWLFDCIKYPISQIFGSGDIPQNIRECKYIPFNRGTTHGRNRVYLGTFETQQDLPKLNTDTIVDSVNVTIPWQANDYRRRSPFTDVYLYLPYIGMTKLSSENLAGQNTITVQYALCMRDGTLICTVTSGGEILGQYSGNVAASVPVGISNINLAHTAQALIATAASVATDSLATFGMASIQYANSVTPNYSCIGGLEGIAATATNQNVTCYTVFHDTIAAPNQNLQVIGAPTMCSKSLGTLSGYCQCADAHVAAAAEAQELDEIDAFLNGGFYIE